MSETFEQILQRLTIATGQVEVREVGRVVDYRVIDAALPRAPRWFTGYGEGHPFVSAEVPEDFRNAWVAHEVLCFEAYRDAQGNQKPGHCANALAAEMAYVPDARIEEYHRLRRDFFRGMARFAELGGYDPAFISEIRGSRDILETLVRGRR